MRHGGLRTPVLVSLAVLSLLAGLGGCSATSDRDTADEELERILAQRDASRVSAGSRSTARAEGTRRLEVLLPPTALRGAEGLACRSGSVLVAERLADRISEIHPDGSVSRFSTPPELIDPRDLAFADTLGLFVASGEAGGLWNEQGGRWRRIAPDLSEATGVATAAGRVFVAECARGGRVVEIEPASGRVLGVRAEKLGCPGRIAIDDAGALLVPLQDKGTVVRIDPASGATSVALQGIDLPTAVGRATDGSWLVLEAGTGRLRRLADGAAAPVQLTPGIADLVVCGETLLVSVGSTGAVHAFKPWPVGARVLVEGGLVSPGGIALDGADVLVADRVSIKRIRGRKATLVVLARPDGLPPPVGLTTGLPGIAWATAPDQGLLVQVDLARGEVLRLATGLDWPTAVARNPTGTLVVAETGAGRVIEVGGGAVGQTLGSSLMSPVAVAIRGESVLAAEPEGGRILALRNGEPPALLASGFSGPSGLASDLRRPIFVAEERSGRILQHGMDGSDRKVATGLALRTRADRLPLPVPIALDQDGSVVVASPEDGSVVRIVPE